jgi:hypothetical protein
VGIIKQDFESRCCDKAEQIAQDRYHVRFVDLPPHLEMQVWMEAEAAVSDQMADELEAAQRRVREKGNHHWDDLELERRKGN